MPRAGAQPDRARSRSSRAGPDLEQVARPRTGRRTRRSGASGSRLTATIVPGRLHPDLVLDRAADPEREVELGLDDLAGLADLLAVRDPARNRPRRASPRPRRRAPRPARSTIPKPSGPPTPRPPATMIRASSIGAGAPASLIRSTTRTAGRAAVGRGRSRPRRDPAAAAGAAVVTFGRTVTIPRPAVNPDVVISLPPNTLISTDGPPSVQVDGRGVDEDAETGQRGDARRPGRGRRRRRPTRIASGPRRRARAATCPAATADQAWSAAAGSVTAQTTGRYVASSAAAAAGSAATTIPTTSRPAVSPRSRASVATSVLMRARPPSGPGFRDDPQGAHQMIRRSARNVDDPGGPVGRVSRTISRGGTGRRQPAVERPRRRDRAADRRRVEPEVRERPRDDLLAPRGHDPLERRVARLAERLGAR